MASARRALWKGAISFGLVHIPVSLHPASGESGIDFDWLDKRSMDPVGYKRINKRTGREIDRENIVRGVEHGSGSYVVLTDKEISATYPRSTQMIEIETFVPASEIPIVYFDRPYYLAPTGKGQKVYALLREALRRSERVGLARVVISTRQHLAALMPSGRALLLNLLRWNADIRDTAGLELPAEGMRATGLGAAELRMAEQLIQSMSGSFQPEKYKDSFRQQVMALVARKAKAGKTQEITQPEEQLAEAGGAEVIDLAELLKKSLKDGKPRPRKARARSRAAA